MGGKHGGEGGSGFMSGGSTTSCFAGILHRDSCDGGVAIVDVIGIVGTYKSFVRRSFDQENFTVYLR